MERLIHQTQQYSPLARPIRRSSECPVMLIGKRLHQVLSSPDDAQFEIERQFLRDAIGETFRALLTSSSTTTTSTTASDTNEEKPAVHNTVVDTISKLPIENSYWRCENPDHFYLIKDRRGNVLFGISHSLWHEIVLGCNLPTLTDDYCTLDIIWTTLILTTCLNPLTGKPRKPLAVKVKHSVNLPSLSNIILVLPPAEQRRCLCGVHKTRVRSCMTCRFSGDETLFMRCPVCQAAFFCCSNCMNRVSHEMDCDQFGCSAVTQARQLLADLPYCMVSTHYWLPFPNR